MQHATQARYLPHAHTPLPPTFFHPSRLRRSHDESTHVSSEMLHDDSAHEPSTAPQLTQPSSSPSQPKGEWHKVPLTLQLLKACSIHPTPEQMVEYEQSPAFLQDAFEVRL